MTTHGGRSARYAAHRYGVAYARRRDPDTSHAAADSFTADDLNKQQRVVLGVLRGSGGVTDEELTALIRRVADVWPEARLSDSAVRTRRRELADLGMVHDTGDRRAVRSGRMAIVWATTPPHG